MHGGHKHTKIFLRELVLRFFISERFVVRESDFTEVVVQTDKHVVRLRSVEFELAVVSAVPDTNDFVSLDLVSDDITIDEYSISPLPSVPVITVKFHKFPVVADNTRIETVI